MQEERFRKKETLEELGILQRNKTADSVFFWFITGFIVESPDLITVRVMHLYRRLNSKILS